MSKRIKDPIYGYINIDEEYLKIVDSVYFQRLRYIIQTSYTSIYPSALHNRFTHSLGVYWLGNIAFDSLLFNSPEVKQSITKSDLYNIKKTFILACLCHDLGHSPFSHTGEKFYNAKEIQQQLILAVSNSKYKADLNYGKNIVGKEHEIMSALLAIHKFGDIIGKANFSFFARCITGLQYSAKSQLSKTERRRLPLYKACIELLNSTIIDVDKLDYLIRDSYMSGYSSVSIDYQRLLGGVFVNDGEHPVGYEKSSLSVLESVLTAHDMERRWIQSHPIIQYEGYLLQTIIREISSEYNTDGNQLLSLPALTEEGVELKDVGNIRLLSDADILYLAKKKYKTSDAVKEYCDRSLRRHPIWKSEAEFSLLFDFKRNDTFVEIITNWEEKLLAGTYGVYSLNETFYEKLKEETEILISLKNSISNESQKTTLDKKISKLNIEIKLIEDIKNNLQSQNIPFDLIIITQQQFKSNIYKSAFKELPIRFNIISNEIKQMKDASFLPSYTKENDIFFYLYYVRNDEKNPINVVDFSKALRRAAVI